MCVIMTTAEARQLRWSGCCWCCALLLLSGCTSLLFDVPWSCWAVLVARGGAGPLLPGAPHGSSRRTFRNPPLSGNSALCQSSLFAFAGLQAAQHCDLALLFLGYRLQCVARRWWPWLASGA